MKTTKMLDSYAILSLLQNEPGADKVSELLEKASNAETKLYMNWLNVGEVYYQIIRRESKKIADETLTELRLLPITFVSVTDELVLSAAEMKAKYSIAFADCFVIATAKEKKAIIVTGDPEFEQVENEVKVEWLERKDENHDNKSA